MQLLVVERIEFWKKSKQTIYKFIIISLPEMLCHIGLHDRVINIAFQWLNIKFIFPYIYIRWNQTIFNFEKVHRKPRCNRRWTDGLGADWQISSRWTHRYFAQLFQKILDITNRVLDGYVKQLPNKHKKRTCAKHFWTTFDKMEILLVFHTIKGNDM